MAAVLIGVVSMALGFLVESFDIAMMVGWAFAIAACSYFPLLLLGAWWKGLTKVGAGGGIGVRRAQEVLRVAESSAIGLGRLLSTLAPDLAERH